MWQDWAYSILAHPYLMAKRVGQGKLLQWWRARKLDRDTFFRSYTARKKLHSLWSSSELLPHIWKKKKKSTSCGSPSFLLWGWNLNTIDWEPYRMHIYVLTVLGAGKSKIRMPVWLGSGESSLSDLEMAGFLLCPHMTERERETDIQTEGELSHPLLLRP